VVVAGGKIMSATRVDFLNGPMEMAKRAVVVTSPDTIALSKSGYFITRKPILSLATQNVGDIILNIDKIAVNNASQDLYDQFIVEAIANNGLDSSIAMILKSMIVIESGFNVRAISMYDTQLPCGTHSYGLIQVTPGCFPQYAAAPAGTPVTATISGGLNGVRPVLTYINKADSIAGNTVIQEQDHLINIVTNPANPLYAGSAFNPAYNLNYGAKALAGFIADVKSRFKTCTQVEYVKMGLAAYNRGGGAVTGCGAYSADANTYVTNLLARYKTFCNSAGIPIVYQ
jgi:soluble lytic murein transglycosylase-like protein